MGVAARRDEAAAARVASSDASYAVTMVELAPDGERDGGGDACGCGELDDHHLSRLPAGKDDAAGQHLNQRVPLFGGKRVDVDVAV